MEELLGSQDGGHLCLDPTLAADHAKQVPRSLAGAQGRYLLLCAYSLCKTEQVWHNIHDFTCWPIWQREPVTAIVLQCIHSHGEEIW